MISEKPYLIQRVCPRKFVPGTASKGIDAFFGFDYMGSSEFEFGALGRALKAMRAQKSDVAILKIEYRFLSTTHEGWVVCQHRFVGEAIDVFRDQVPNTHKMRFKERTDMADAYGLAGEHRKDAKYTGWWCIDEGHEWIIFKNKEDAETWLKVL